MKFIKYLFILISFLLPALTRLNASDAFYFTNSFKNLIPFPSEFLSLFLSSILFVFGLYFTWFFYNSKAWNKRRKLYYLIYSLPLIILCRQSLHEMAVMHPAMGSSAFLIVPVFAYPLYKSALRESSLFRLSGVFLFLGVAITVLNTVPGENVERFDIDYANYIFWQDVLSFMYWFSAVFILAAFIKTLKPSKVETK